MGVVFGVLIYALWPAYNLSDPDTTGCHGGASLAYNIIALYRHCLHSTIPTMATITHDSEQHVTLIMLPWLVHIH